MGKVIQFRKKEKPIEYQEDKRWDYDRIEDLIWRAIMGVCIVGLMGVLVKVMLL